MAVALVTEAAIAAVPPFATVLGLTLARVVKPGCDGGAAVAVGGTGVGVRVGGTGVGVLVAGTLVGVGGEGVPPKPGAADGPVAGLTAKWSQWKRIDGAVCR